MIIRHVYDVWLSHFTIVINHEIPKSPKISQTRLSIIIIMIVFLQDLWNNVQHIEMLWDCHNQKTDLFNKKRNYVKIMKEMYHLATSYWIKSTSMYLKIVHAFISISVWYQMWKLISLYNFTRRTRMNSELLFWPRSLNIILSN